ncbi:hypothetical protein BDZ45DRAFT_807858 [Acephala macrosclerotiorum]|nr:hypothetical protein BDZ45DRAFT_807858 [Acephala macrosclerotiorum]
MTLTDDQPIAGRIPIYSLFFQRIEPSRPKPIAITNGLTAGQAIGAMLVGGVICAIVTWLCGEPGIKYHLGFPMMSRATFGMYGSFFIVVLKCFTNFLYCRIQTHWGGLATHIILAAIPQSYHHMKKTFPTSANITTADLVGTVYFCCFVPLLLIKPHKLHYFSVFSFFSVIATIIGMFIWAMAANHGAGDLVAPAKNLSRGVVLITSGSWSLAGGGDTAFAFIQTICTVCGSFTDSSIRHSDWSRCARTPSAIRVSIWVACPVVLTLTAMSGVFVTSAARAMHGEIIWQPLNLLLYIQKTDYSPHVRAGTFFAGLGWFLSQLAVSISLNSVSAGMDLAAVLPQFLNVRRGSLLLAFVGFACCPRNYVNSPGHSLLCSAVSVFSFLL